MQNTSDAQLPVNIRQNCEVDNELVNVRKSAGDVIVWHSDGDEFTVQFPNSPFAEHRFVVPAGGSVSSGKVRSDAATGPYEYGITNSALAMSADPGVNIVP